MPKRSSPKHAPPSPLAPKKAPAQEILLAQEQEIQQLIARFQASTPTGVDVQKLEVLVRTALFKPAAALVAFLLQASAEQIDAAYQPKPGEQRKAREPITIDCIFGSFVLERDYYYHPGKEIGHYPADDALGIEAGKTPALLRLVCLEGADEASYQKAEEHLRETGGIGISARQIQRTVQQVGAGAQAWQQRQALKALPECQPAPILYVSADATGLPMRQEELEGRKGKQPDGTAKTRSAYLGCVFTQHRRDEQGRPVRDYQSTTYVSGEAGCKTVIGSRCKQSAMFWGKPGAENVLALRCIRASRRLDAFWKDRLNAQAARNDCLAISA